MDEIRVLHMKHRLSADGATVIILNMAKQLEGKITIDWLLNSHEDSYWHEIFRDLGGEIYELQTCNDTNRIKRFYKNYKSYEEFFLNHPYNILHIDTDGFGRLNVLLAAKKAGIKRRIMHSHNSKSEGNGIFSIPVLQTIGRRLYKALATDYVACSEKAAHWLFPANVQKQVLIIKNGIDTNRFRFDAEKRTGCRKELGLGDELLIGHIGRFAEQKNHIFLIEVFQKIHEKDPNARLLLIGTGNLKQVIMEKIAVLGLSDAVIMIDETTCPERYYCAMDVFVLPSLFEGLGIVAIEAQCSGLPCFLSTECPREAKLATNCHFLSLSDGAEAWCDRINEEKKADIVFRKKAYQTVLENGYDIRQSAEQLYALYCK